MPSLDKTLIEYIINNSTETRLVIEDRVDYHGMEPNVFWEQLYAAFKTNQTLRELWLVNLEADVVAKLAIIFDDPANQISGISLEKLSAAAISMLVPYLQKTAKVNGIGLRSLDSDAIEVILPVLFNLSSRIEFIGLKELDPASTKLLGTYALQTNNLKALGLVDLSEKSLVTLFNYLQYNIKRPQIICSQFISETWQQKFNLLNSTKTKSA